MRAIWLFKWRDVPEEGAFTRKRAGQSIPPAVRRWCPRRQRGEASGAKLASPGLIVFITLAAYGQGGRGDEPDP